MAKEELEEIGVKLGQFQQENKENDLKLVEEAGSLLRAVKSMLEKYDLDLNEDVILQIIRAMIENSSFDQVEVKKRRGSSQSKIPYQELEECFVENRQTRSSVNFLNAYNVWFEKEGDVWIVVYEKAQRDDNMLTPENV